MPKKVPRKKNKKKNSSFIKKIQIYKNKKDNFLTDRQFEKMEFATRAIHAGSTPDPVHGGVSPVIDLSSTYAQTRPNVASGGFMYGRGGSPTTMTL